MSPFISCPSCACAVHGGEDSCPHCGSRLRGPDGHIAKTAVFALLGLVGLAGCSAQAPKYGVPATDGERDATSAPTPDTATTSSASSSPPEPVPIYGQPGTSGR